MNKILQIIIIIIIIVVGLLLMIFVPVIFAVGDLDHDFVKEKNLSHMNCTELKEEIINIGPLCQGYFRSNKEYYCQRNIIEYYTERCGASI